MNGTSSTTGRRLGGIDHLRQSVRDILATPLGSRVMRRDYGSRLFALIDALQRWESRIAVERVTASRAAPGSITLDIRGTYLPEGRPILLDGIEVRR